MCTEELNELGVVDFGRGRDHERKMKIVGRRANGDELSFVETIEMHDQNAAMNNTGGFVLHEGVWNPQLNALIQNCSSSLK